MEHEIKNEEQEGGRARFRTVTSWQHFEMNDNLWPFPSLPTVDSGCTKGSNSSWTTLIPSLEGPSSKKLSWDCKIPFNLSIQVREESAQI